MRSRLLALTALLAALAVPGHARAADPVFHGSISAIDAQLRERMTGSSWHRGCPVRIRDLRLLRLDRWGFDGTVRRGRLIVHEDQARRVKRVFSRLFDAHFRIRRMRLIDFYNGSDDRSMDANNTSAFNCRFVAGTTRWSQHAYGLAIDINPFHNPYLRGDLVAPELASAYVDRDWKRPGMIFEGDVVTDAFDAIGWGWGGRWNSLKDWMHFSLYGN